MGCSPQEKQISISHKPEPPWALASLEYQPSAAGKALDQQLQTHPQDTPPGTCSCHHLSVLMASHPRLSKCFCLHHRLWAWALWKPTQTTLLGPTT